MNRRRAFLTATGAGIAALGLGAQNDTARAPRQYYEFRFFRMAQGDRPGRFHQFCQRLLPLLDKHQFTPMGFFDVVLGPETPSIVTLNVYDGPADRERRWAPVMAEPDFRKAFEELESGSEPPFSGADAFLLRATDYSPPVKASPGDQKPRLFELRIYHSPTARQMMALHERFGGPEIKIFHRTGVHPILYGDMVFGQNTPNLVYLTPFNTLADREKAWAAFGADPEWQKVRAESIAKSGQIVSNVSSMMLRATAYSPIR